MKNGLLIILIIFCACSSQSQVTEDLSIQTGADQMDRYLPKILNKKVGVMVNHSSLIGSTHLTDTLILRGVNLTKVFTPEHGFTGTISDGVEIDYNEEDRTYELISLYGKTKKASPEQMENLDVIIFDIQDVGTRFYTYISTMHYLMEACAENNVPLIILDRPNPNGSYVDGPVLDTALRSFVGIHPIPIVHGLTVGELAQMINGEGWLKDGVQCDLEVIQIKNWSHQDPYSLPVNPSPNLPGDLSIALYPSLCLFEGTVMSVGRGTDYAFQHIGHPAYPDTAYSFTPKSRPGAKWPPLEDQKCYGRSWIGSNPEYGLTLKPLIEAYQKMDSEEFFNDYFKRLAGTYELQQQIEAGMTEDEIKATWQPKLDAFKATRQSYLLYN